jgi:hypothetical protein
MLLSNNKTYLFFPSLRVFLLTEANAVITLFIMWSTSDNCNKGTNANLAPTAKIKIPFEYLGICSPHRYVPGSYLPVKS